jgi:hypothetical protein
VAEYLDNTVTPEQAAEVEQICLSSDVHLAEAAACHQILTLILGEPVKPPASASQRMYGLVKGPGAIPFRKPSGGKAKSAAEPYSESREIDETLRLGLPALGRQGGWRNPLILIGGGFLAAIVLVVAIFQIVNLPGPKDTQPGPDGLAQADKNKTDKTQAAKDSDKDKENSKTVTDKKGGDDTTSTDQKDSGKDKKVDDKKDSDAKVEVAPAAQAAFGPPNPRQAPIGHYVPEAKEILLQAVPDAKLGWKRLTAKQSEVHSARPLVSLPGSRSVVETNRGVRVTLWGNMMPEFIAGVPAFFESRAELYAHDVLDLDLLLNRGRVVLTSAREKPVHVRLRFENPLVPSDKELVLRQEFFDITLQNKGASFLIDLWSFYPSTEPFYKDPKHPNRIGPTANMVCMVLDGTVLLKTGDVTYTMAAPPGPGLMLWNSLTGPKGPSPLPKRLDEVLDNPPLAAGMDPKVRKDMVKACEFLSTQLTNTNVDVGLAQSLYAPDPSIRRLVVRSLAAIADLPSLLEALGQDKFADVRQTAVDALRNWIANARDNDYKLFHLLKEKYKSKEAEIIMEMMHSFSAADIARPGLYELLIEYLVSPNLVIRELAAYHLRVLVPAGRNIPYAADADSQVRENAVIRWRALIPPGQVPASLAPGARKK